MKTRVLIPLLFIFINTFSLMSRGPVSRVRSSAGTNFEINSSNYGREGYVISITERFHDMIDKDLAFILLNIRESDLEQFKYEMKQVYDTYVRWYLIAEENNVKEVEKEIPVNITSVRNVWGSGYASPPEVSTKFYFRVFDYNPTYYWKISIGQYGRRFYVRDWRFKEAEIFGLIEEMEKNLNERKAIDRKKQNIDALFD